MNRNKLLVVSGAILISIFIALVFWIQTGLNGLPNVSDIKVEYKLVFLQKLNITNEEVLSEIVEPLAISTENPLNKGKIIFCSIGEMNSIKNPLPIAPIVGMNYFRYNFMSKGMYSFKDRIQDDRLFFEQLKTDANFTDFLNSVRKKQFNLNVENLKNEINGVDVFLVNPNFTGKEKGIYQSIKEVKDYISKKQNLYNNDKQIKVKIFIDLNGPSAYDKTEETITSTTLTTTQDEGDEIEITTNVDNPSESNKVSNVCLGSDRQLTWDGEIKTLKIRITSTEINDIIKEIAKHQTIPLSDNERENLTQINPKRTPIKVEYYDPKKRKYMSVDVKTGSDKIIHCYNILP